MIRWKLTRPIFCNTGDGDGGGNSDTGGAGGGGDANAGGAGDGDQAGDGANRGGDGNVFSDAARRAAAEANAGGDGGSGEGGDTTARPDHIPEQFWRDGSLDSEAWAKSWKDDRDYIRQLREGQGLKPPENADGYTVTLPEGMQVKEGDTLLGAFKTAAHKAGLSQPLFDAVLGPVLEHLKASLPTPMTEAEHQAHLDKTFEELGGREKAQRMIDVNYQYYTGLADKGILPRAAIDEMMGDVGLSPGSLMVFNKMRELAGERPIPTDVTATDLITQEQLDSWVASKEYQEGDPAMREKVERGFEQLYGNAPSGSANASQIQQPLPQHLRELNQQK